MAGYCSVFDYWRNHVSAVACLGCKDWDLGLLFPAQRERESENGMKDVRTFQMRERQEGSFIFQGKAILRIPE